MPIKFMLLMGSGRRWQMKLDVFEDSCLENRKDSHLETGGWLFQQPDDITFLGGAKAGRSSDDEARSRSQTQLRR